MFSIYLCLKKSSPTCIAQCYFTNIELTSYCSNDALVQGGIIFRAMDCGAVEYLLCEKGVHQPKSHSCWLVGSLRVIRVVSGHPNTTISAQQDCVIS